MAYAESIIEQKIKSNIIYNSIILLIFIFWFVYSTLNNISLLFFIVLVISIIIFFIILRKFRQGISLQEKLLYSLLLIIPFSLVLNIINFPQMFSSPFLIPFDSLIGIKHNHNFLLILFYFSFILLKLLVIKIYFIKKIKKTEIERGEVIFQFFTSEFKYKKAILLGTYFPLSALVEELIYRTLLLSVFTYYLIGII